MFDICTSHANQVNLSIRCTPPFECHKLDYRCATFALSRIGRGPKGGETAVRREMGLWSVKLKKDDFAADGHRYWDTFVVLFRASPFALRESNRLL